MKRIEFLPRHLLASLVATIATVASVSAAPFTVNGNGAYQANVMRHYDAGGNLTTTYATSATGTGTFIQYDKPIDAAGRPTQWNELYSNTGVIQFTLSQSYNFKQFVHEYLHNPGSYEIYVSDTGFGSLTLAASGPVGGFGATVTDVLVSPITGRYIEYRAIGGGGQYALLTEFSAFAAAGGANPVLETTGGYNVLVQSGVSLSSTGSWIDAVSSVGDGNVNTFLRGAGSGDATFTVDLQSSYDLTNLTLGFYNGQSWASGAKIELSLNNSSWVTAFDSGSMVGDMDINLVGNSARYLRVTNYGGSSGAMTEFQVTAVPEPSTFAFVLMVGAGILFLRRRRVCFE